MELLASNGWIIKNTESGIFIYPTLTTNNDYCIEKFVREEHNPPRFYFSWEKALASGYRCVPCRIVELIEGGDNELL